MVSTLGFADLHEVYSIREGLELAAGRAAIQLASDEAIRALREPVMALEAAWGSRADYADSLVADLGFHRQFVSLSANSRLIAIHEQMLSQTLLLARTAAIENPAIRRAQRRSAHRNILDALVKRSPDVLSRAITHHYEYAGERLFARRTTRDRSATSTHRDAPRRKGSVVAAGTAAERRAAAKL
jgi:DNA-binding GntR family transcriptional regulator